MNESQQEKELKTFGFTGKLRTGLITTIIGIQFAAIVYLFTQVQNLNDYRVDDKDKMYQQMLDIATEKAEQKASQTVDEKLDPVVKKVDTISANADSTFNLIKERMK